MFWSRLRKHHAVTWERLGCPVVFLSCGPVKFSRFLSFLWRKEYESLPDRDTVAFGRLSRSLFIWSLVLGILTCGALIFVAWTQL